MVGDNKSKLSREILEEMKDEDLIKLYREGRKDVIDLLIKRYKGFVRNKIKVSFLVGVDKDDLIQEGMIGLFKAICDYNPDKESSFKSFATLCVTRQISTAFKKVTRQKHMPLNQSISLSGSIHRSQEDDEMTLQDIIKNHVSQTPEDEIISKETIEDINEYIEAVLSELEIQVLNYHMEGKNYRDIAVLLNKSPKSIDNALQRIRKKLESVKGTG